MTVDASRCLAAQGAYSLAEANLQKLVQVAVGTQVGGKGERRVRGQLLSLAKKKRGERESKQQAKRLPLWVFPGSLTYNY